MKLSRALICATALALCVPAEAQQTRLQVNGALSIYPAALSTSAVAVLPANAYLVARTVCNLDTAIVEYAGNSDVTGATNGVKLPPGSCWDFSHTNVTIYMVAASGTPNAVGVQY